MWLFDRVTGADSPIGKFFASVLVGIVYAVTILASLFVLGVCGMCLSCGSCNCFERDGETIAGVLVVLPVAAGFIVGIIYGISSYVQEKSFETNWRINQMEDYVIKVVKAVKEAKNTSDEMLKIMKTGTVYASKRAKEMSDEAAELADGIATAMKKSIEAVERADEISEKRNIKSLEEASRLSKKVETYIESLNEKIDEAKSLYNQAVKEENEFSCLQKGVTDVVIIVKSAADNAAKEAENAEKCADVSVKSKEAAQKAAAAAAKSKKAAEEVIAIRVGLTKAASAQEVETKLALIKKSNVIAIEQEKIAKEEAKIAIQEKKYYLEAEEKGKKKESLIKSAQKGDMNAQYDLSVWYLNEKNLEQYVHLLRKAAEQGHTTAQYQLGLMCLEGKAPIERNTQEAVVWLEKVAQKGDKNAQYNLGCMYIEVDIQKALHWLDKAVKQEHKLAIFRLACLHADQIHPNSDYNVAFKLFNKMLTLDTENPLAPLAKIYLGALYCAGKGTERSPEMGSKLINDGMSRNQEEVNPNFCFRLGILHYKGRVGVYDNKEIKDCPDIRKEELLQAIDFFKKAYDSGIKDDHKYLKKAREELKDALKNFISQCKDVIKSYSETERDHYNRRHERIVEVSNRLQSSFGMLSRDAYEEAEKEVKRSSPYLFDEISYSSNIKEIEGKITQAENQLNTIEKEIKTEEDEAFDW